MQGSNVSGQGSFGTFQVANLRHDRGFAAGSTYAVAPGFSLFLSYLWGDRTQPGVNLLTGEAGSCAGNAKGGMTCTNTPASFLHNSYTMQALSLGAQLRW
jgi:hypothetical protein